MGFDVEGNASTMTADVIARYADGNYSTEYDATPDTKESWEEVAKLVAQDLGAAGYNAVITVLDTKVIVKATPPEAPSGS